ncbi:hypothetical protein [Nocardia sp. R7R-8]|uniref:hypothetical protein n=1 Tax=Nocardia sp. R7R-8 TaxID=3459304 RepID=UPI00403DBA79
MSPDTECVEYENGVRTGRRTTYDEAVKEQSHETGIHLITIGASVVGAGLVGILLGGWLDALLEPGVGLTTTLLHPTLALRLSLSPPQPPRPVPVPAAAPPPDNFRLLLSMVGGDTATAQRLIEYERRRYPAADRATLIAKAIETLQRDRGR